MIKLRDNDNNNNNQKDLLFEDASMLMIIRLTIGWLRESEGGTLGERKYKGKAKYGIVHRSNSGIDW